MTTKQFPTSQFAPDGSLYITLSDGAGTLMGSFSIATTGGTKQSKGLIAPDGSIYVTLTDGNGTLK